MPIRISQSTQEYLINAALPEVTATYTVISHKQIIDKVKEVLDKKGFIIERELYKCSKDAQMAQGIYHLKYGNDPDMSMSFAWSNSYDKTMKFKCSIGAYVHSSLSTILSGNIVKFKRKHTGTADQEAFDMITQQIDNADAYFNNLVADKEQMKLISITEESRAEFMGVLYLVKELVTGEQLGTIKHEFKKPSFVYNGLQDSIWIMYNAIIYSLQKAHPKTWMDQQSMVHYLICEKFGIIPGIMSVITESDAALENTDTNIPTNQIDLEEMIKEVQLEAEINKVDPISVEGLAKISDETTGNITKTEKFDAAKLIAEAAAQREAEERASELLHEVNNDNVEATLQVPTIPIPEASPVVGQIKDEKPLVQPEKPAPEPVKEEDEGEGFAWICQGCGDLQGPTDIFYEGQLCGKCFNAKNSL